MSIQDLVLHTAAECNGSDSLYRQLALVLGPADLNGTGVTATALCPGPVSTEFGEAAGISPELQEGPRVVYKPPDEVARTAIDALAKGRRLVVPGLANKLGSVFGHYTPRSVAIPLLDRFYPVGK